MTDPKTITEARADIETALKRYHVELDKLDASIKGNHHDSAQQAWKDAHAEVLLLKGAHNALYRHLAELKPKKADKMKPGGKLDNEPEKESRKGRRAAEPEVSSQGSDEP
jgi:hypothetical protein